MSWWDDWGPALPVEGGLVASGKLRGPGVGADVRSLGAEIVRRVVERVNTGVATRGRSYARNGQTITMTIEPGRIHATIQGSSSDPYSVTLACTVPIEHRDRLIAAFRHSLPNPASGIPARGSPGLRAEIDGSGLLIGVPITAKCSCPYGAVCKHCVALAYVAAERLDGSPIAIATLLGVRDEDLVPAADSAGGGGRGDDGAGEADTAVDIFDPQVQTQLARALTRLDRRDPPTVDDVIARAIRTLQPAEAILAQLGIESPDPAGS